MRPLLGIIIGLLVLGAASSGFAADTPRAATGKVIATDSQYYVWA